MANTSSSDCISVYAGRTNPGGLCQGSEVLASFQLTAARAIKRAVHAGLGLTITIIGDSQIMAQDMKAYPHIVEEHLSIVRDSFDEHGIRLLIE